MLKNSNLYTAAVIGCGRAGFSYDFDPKRKETYTHLSAYNKSSLISNIIAVDTNKEVLLEVQNKFPTTKTYESAEQMFSNENIDIVSIATSANQREYLINLAIENNVKAIFSEKPLSVTYKSAINILNLCKSKNVHLAINHFRRWDQFHKNISKFIREGKVGKIQCVTFKYNNGILNTGSHVFDLLRMFFGEIKSIKALSRNLINDKIGDPTFSADIRFHSGLIVDLIGCDARKFRIFEIDIVGTKARIVIDNGYDMDYYVVGDSPHNSEFKIFIKTDPPFTKGRYFHFEEAVSNIVKSIEKNENILCEGADGLKSIEASLAAWISFCINEDVVLPFNKKYYSVNVNDIVK